jgi:hypothetical protein
MIICAELMRAFYTSATGHRTLKESETNLSGDRNTRVAGSNATRRIPALFLANGEMDSGAVSEYRWTEWAEH